MDLEHYLSLLEYELALQEAEDDLLRFAEVTMPEMRFPDDISRTRYKAGKHHRLMADLMMQVERGERRKVIINTAPRHGKSELCTKRFCAWYSALHPEQDIIVATYNEKFALDFGKDIREIMSSPRFQQVFPEFYLKSASNETVTTYAGGDIFFLGRRSSTTGRGANLIIVDDPTKDDKDVRYDGFREDVWQWFTQTLLTRRHDDRAALVVSQCMTGDTPVRMADGSEMSLRDVRAGDLVATYDNGRLSTSKITKWSKFGADPVFAIRTKSGKVVRANARHPFLVAFGDGKVEWRRTGMLKKGDAILRATGESGKASLAQRKAASFLSGAEATANLTIRRPSGQAGIGRLPSILARAARLTCETAMELALRTMIAWSPSRAACALSASTRLMPEGLQTIGARSSAWTTATTQEGSVASSATSVIWWSEAATHRKSSWPPLSTSDFTPDEIVSIEPDGVEEVYDITVERTENFIANGLVSHNTRWHEDDIVGRITDKQNPAYSPKFSEGFEIVNLPAIAEYDDPLKRKPGEPLWPERFGLKYLEEMQDANPASFAALYQCDPTPDDGVFFRVEEIHEYEAGELPEKLTMYVASDHAVGTKNINDPSCLVPFGLDENGTAWVMPQIVWRRMDAQEAVEEMIGIMRNQKPVFWYAEKGHITKSIGPFLSKRMEEEGVYTPVLEEQPIGDKIQRAQSGRARCAQGKIKFPKHAPWWPRAKAELLKFPNARFDDFVDVVSMIGLKVGYHTGPSKVIQKPKHQPGTFGYMLAEFRKQDREDAFRSEAAGWGVSR
jgi:predicted phage terminase large subunit-like protein